MPDSRAFANPRARHKDSDSDAFAQPWCNDWIQSWGMLSTGNKEQMQSCFSAVLCAAVVMAGSLFCDYTIEFVVPK